ncbi:TetR/AcrR family transcriptional regulator [Mycobacterium sp. pR1184]|uniref:TetR/AcrR family transcriptional regulator n=1 Tax=Mycobacterium sp. pR1184 TaxID=3238981 RepID=UPI00351AC711
MTHSAASPVVRKSAAVRRAEILEAAAVEFAETGFAGTRFEVIAARAAVSHPRIVQMFGSKRALFLEVIDGAFDRVITEFASAAGTAGTARLTVLGDAYRRLLQRDRTVALLMLQGFAASGEATVRDAVASRYLALQDTVAALTGADALQVRSFIATGLVVTVSSALALPGKRTDARWGAWLLELAQGDAHQP